MVARIYNNFRRYTQTEWIESLSEANTFIYAFIGKSTAWPDDTTPPLPTESNSDILANWSDMLAAKKIAAGDVVPVVRRYNWTFGTIYPAYSSTDVNLFVSSQFYVLTTGNNVYKCLFNRGGVASTIEPTGTTTNNIVTADGYVWKYMYSLDATDLSKFLSSAWMPVKTNSTVAAAAVDGALDVVNVLTGGAGYVTPAITITSLTGTGATATAVVTGGVITAINITNRGTGYRDATVVIGGPGTGATASVPIAMFGGHGVEPIRELGCRNAMITVDFNGSEGGTFPVTGNYRKIGLIRNPLVTAGTLASGTSYAASSLKFGSGEQIYIEHRRPIARAIDQNELYKFVLYF